ncbi:MAG: mannitol dehydrogenase family protein [Bifidobacteriaceae bacterium]|jgi:fructuronate reductase|nr:mannitol dehydrogenase family protein [Bifidobacteriaceae bacterium]
MTKLTDSYDDLAGMGVKTPQRNLLIEPVKWVHFGGGNLFRCFHASIWQKLVDQGLTQSPLALIEAFDSQLINQIYHKYNNRTLNVILSANGSFALELVDCIKPALDTDNKDDWMQAKQLLASPDLQMVTLAVTEKGYNIKDLSGNYFPDITQELGNGPKGVITLMGKLASLLYVRFLAGAKPLALCSTDNFSHNGDKLKSSITEIVGIWVKKGLVETDFLDYLNSSQVSFPLSMIDRITPQPAPSVAEELDSLGFVDTQIVKTDKGTVSAAFVNTEETHYLVIEDNFPNGRPNLEAAGVILTTRHKVDEVERMKVCTCLNPLHTSLAILGCLLDYKAISQQMQNPNLVKLIKRIGYIEGLPVVTDPKIISPKQFIDEVIAKRLPNPFIPDTPQRIAMDTSQKIPIRFGVTISLYKQQGKDIANLKGIAFTLAAWLRYLMAVDDQGNKFVRSSDPMLEQLDKFVADLELGSSNLDSVLPLLHDKTIFSVDLYEVKNAKISLADMVIEYLTKLLAGKGAVAKTLAEVVNEIEVVN